MIRSQSKMDDEVKINPAASGGDEPDPEPNTESTTKPKKKLSRKSERKKSGRNKTQILPKILSGTLSRRKNKTKASVGGGELNETTRAKSSSCYDLSTMEAEAANINLGVEAVTGGCKDYGGFATAMASTSAGSGSASVSHEAATRDSGYDDMLINNAAPVGVSNYQRKESVVSAIGEDFEEKREKYRREANNKIDELIKTERNYIQHDLKQLVEGFIQYMEKSKEKPTPKGYAPMPEDLSGGKDRIAFGNIRDLYDFHTKCILPELEKAADYNVAVILNLFKKRKNDLKEKYGKFCINKPKSEYIISQYEEYFNMVGMALRYHHSLGSLLMTPIQRVTRYNLLLKDITNYLRKAEDTEKLAIVDEALAITHNICNYANDMMIAGRMQGFIGDVTRQGLLLMKGEATCYKRKHAWKKSKPKDCMIFVFRESIIVCIKVPSIFGQNVVTQNCLLDYWVSFQTNNVKTRELGRGPDYGACFELERKNYDKVRKLSTSDKPEESAIIVKCDNEEQRDKWLKIINDQIIELDRVALELSNPKASFRC